MAEPSIKKLFSKFIWLYFLVGGIVIFLLIPWNMARTSKNEYCLSCHYLQTHQNELEKSSHALDKDKKPIQCAQCHIPPTVGPKYLAVKSFLGMKDLIIHYLGDPERMNRRNMQEVARRFIMDENCLACHEDLNKDVKGQPLSEIGKLCHDAYLGKNGTTKHGCAGCHQNLAHLPEFDRRYLVNAKFAERLPLEKEKK
ncbi:MAG: cytochrome C [Deltaproteobacteria bacterium]|nr:cytochrome C [Deltaproteobacteria bacterium]